MVKKLLYTFGLVSLLVPAVALANENHAVSNDQQNGAQVGTTIDVHLNTGDMNSDEGTSVNVESDNAASSHGSGEGMQGEEHSGATSSSDIRHHEGDNGASSSMHEEDRGGNDILGIGAFFHWFFGLPASTTVGEIRAGAEASTSADVHGGSSESAPNVFADFMARLSAFFGF